MTAHVYLHTPQVAFKARVNLASPVYPLTTIPFDTVTVGAFGDIQADMFMVIGSADGLDDRGRTRVQNVATSTNIPIGRTSQGTHDGELDIRDNDFITVYDDYRVHSKIPYIDDDGNQYKDTNVPVDDYTGTDIPPVANCGPGFAGYTSSSIITVEFDGSNSFAMADGETIATYAWDIKDGTVLSGDIDEVTLIVSFPAGFRWVALTVIDTNGIPHTARCPVLAVNAAADVTLPHVVPELTISPQGQRLTLRVMQDIPQATYPDGTLVMFWEGNSGDPDDRSHMQFIGWEQSNEADGRATRTGLLRGTQLHCVDVTGRLAALPGFPQSLERAAVVNNWDKMIAPNMDKYIHYILLWHSTALGLADYFPSGTGDDYPFVIFASEGESLYDQVENEAKALIPTHHFTCNLRGQLAVVPDPMLQPVVERTATLQGNFTEATIASIRFAYTRPPRTHWLRGHALLTATGYTDVDGVDTLLTVHCIAPGLAPGQGVGESTTSEGLARSQLALNVAKGHEYARLNSRYGPITVTPTVDTQFDAIDPAALEWVKLTVTSATDAQRGLTFDEVRCQVKEIRRRWEESRTGEVRRGEYTLEVETFGPPAITVLPEGAPTPVPEVAPDFGLVEGAELVAGIDLDGNVYRTTDFQTDSGSGGPTWDSVDLGIAETLYTFTVDPFSPGYILGSGSIDGWIASEDAIYRVDDLFGTPSATDVHTFATTADAASFHWRTIQASFGEYFAGGDNPWLLCVSYYGDTVGHSGTWSTYSVDGGVTWSTEVQISQYYDFDVATRFNPIGVYTSPRTPGLAYTAAHSAPVDDVVEQLPAWGYYDDSSGSGNYTYLGLGTQFSITASSTSTGPVTNDEEILIIAPPADTKRIEVLCEWWVTNVNTGGLGSQGNGINLSDPSGINRVGDSNETQPSANTSDSGSFTSEYSFPAFAGGDWPELNRDTIVGSPPADDEGVQYEIHVSTDAASGQTRTQTLTIRVTVTEIELDDGTIYAPALGAASGYVSTDWGATWNTTALIEPGSQLAGMIHAPFEDNAAESIIYFGHTDMETNREFKLKRSVSGVITDISPVDTAVSFGSNRPGFTIRAYDSDRQYLLLAGIGNDTSADPDDDLHGVFASDDAGATWTTIVSPIADSGAPTNRPAFEAAFAGDTEQVIFVWGPPDTIGYSDDLGVSVDDRSGNLSGTLGFIGIAGGPI